LATCNSFHTQFDAADHSEIRRLAIAMEDHKSEIENWDLGAGIYVSFYSIRSSLPDANNIMSELVKKLVLDFIVF